MGTVALRRPGDEGCDIGYWIAPPFWNEGLATEAVRAAVAGHPFGAVPIRATVFRDNPASARVLEASGFERVGEAESFSVARGEAVPAWTFLRAPDRAA